jgi:predicted N-acetyltransferase YhbS
MDYMRMREAVGWRNPSGGAVEKGLEGTLYGVVARVNGKDVGMARVIGDGAITFYIQDVVVYPEFQGQGIGNGLMEYVMRFIGMHAAENAVVGLMSAAGKEEFYTRFGFTQRPTEKLGCGMTIFWKRKD